MGSGSLHGCSWPQGLGVGLSSSLFLPPPFLDLLVKWSVPYKQNLSLLMLRTLCIAWSLCTVHLQQKLWVLELSSKSQVI